MNTLIADIETDGLLPELTRIWVLTVGDPRLEDDEIAYADQPGYPPLKEGLKRLSEADRVVFHNGLGFDLHVINRLFPGTLRFEQMYDTLVVSRLVDPERKAHALEDWGKILGHPKVEHDEWDRFSPEMVHRNIEDVKLGKKVFKKLWPRAKSWEPHVITEHKVALVIALQEQNGFRLDLEAAVALEGELRQEQVDIERRLQEIYPPVYVEKKTKGSSLKVPKRGKVGDKTPYIAGAPFSVVEYQPFNPGSRQQIEFRLRRDYKWKPKKFTPTGAALLDDGVLADLAILYPEAKELARYFRVKKQLGQLADGDNAWLKLYREHGDECRVHGRVNPCGTVTYRMSHFSPNMGQADKKEKRMRAVWVPRKDWVLVGCDAEGLELRMLGHYLNKYDGGAYSESVVSGSKDDGTDVHSRAQHLLDFFSRDGVKPAEYAYFYGAGNPKLGFLAIDDAQNCRLADGTIVDKYNPDDAPQLFKSTGNFAPLSPGVIGKTLRGKLETGIVGLEDVVELCRKKHRTQKYIVSLDGRRVKTRSEHASLNTLLQSAGAIVMKVALVIFHFERAVAAGLVSSDFLTTNGFAYCANVHDEVQIEAEPDKAEMIGKLFADCIREAGERLGVRCPLAGAYSVGANWKETH